MHGVVINKIKYYVAMGDSNESAKNIACVIN